MYDQIFSVDVACAVGINYFLRVFKIELRNIFSSFSLCKLQIRGKQLREMAPAIDSESCFYCFCPAFLSLSFEIDFIFVSQYKNFLPHTKNLLPLSVFFSPEFSHKLQIWIMTHNIYRCQISTIFVGVFICLLKMIVLMRTVTAKYLNGNLY